jgi:hypothetical protein
VSRGKKPVPAAASRGRRFGRRLAIVTATLAAAAGLVWGLARLGDEARQGIWPRDRYRVRFDAIDCDTPPGRDRATFLAEVRYLANAPETVSALAPDLSTSLASAFIKHPWVAACESVRAGPAGGIQVRLRFRKPVLAVQTASGPRVVDAGGVLLPLDADRAGLPELMSPLAPPPTPAGQVWADETIAKALALVDAHHPRSLERAATGWRLTLGNGQTLRTE